MKICNFFSIKFRYCEEEKKNNNIKFLYFHTSDLVCINNKHIKIGNKRVLSPEGTAKAVPKVVQLFLLMFYFWVGNVYWTFKIRIFHRPFWDLENVLSPKGTAKAVPKVVQLFLLMFYPPKGLRKQYRRWSNCFYLCFNLWQGND